VDGERAVAAAGRDQQAQEAAALLGGEELLLVAGRQAAPLGLDPDLEEVDRLGARAVELAVDDAAAGAHALDLTGPQHTLAAGAVSVRQRAFHHDRDDLHVLVVVGAEAPGRRHGVLVKDAQGAESHVLLVVVARERERVEGRQPAVPADAPLLRLAYRNHRNLVAPRAGPLSRIIFAAIDARGREGRRSAAGIE